MRTPIVVDLTQTDSESEEVAPRANKRARYATRPASSDNDDVVVLGVEEVQQLRMWASVGAGATPTAALDGDEELVVAGERGQVRAVQLAHGQQRSLYAAAENA